MELFYSSVLSMTIKKRPFDFSKFRTFLSVKSFDLNQLKFKLITYNTIKFEEKLILHKISSSLNKITLNTVPRGTFEVGGRFVFPRFSFSLFYEKAPFDRVLEKYPCSYFYSFLWTFKEIAIY